LQAQTRAVAEAYSSFRTNGANADRVCEILEAPLEISEPSGAPQLPPVKGHVVMEHVTFGYLAGQPVLKDVSLEIPRANHALSALARKSTRAFDSALLRPWVVALA
jgi:ABC-type multidrug transport system fused ATPase/permease subunit